MQSPRIRACIVMSDSIAQASARNAPLKARFGALFSPSILEKQSKKLTWQQLFSIGQWSVPQQTQARRMVSSRTVPHPHESGDRR